MAFVEIEAAFRAIQKTATAELLADVTIIYNACCTGDVCGMEEKLDRPGENNKQRKHLVFMSEAVLVPARIQQ